jgi:hypothetical protein
VPSAGHAHLYDPQVGRFNGSFWLVLTRRNRQRRLDARIAIPVLYRAAIRLPEKLWIRGSMNNFRRKVPYRWIPAVILDPIREVHNDRLRGRCQRHVSSRK